MPSLRYLNELFALHGKINISLRVEDGNFFTDMRNGNFAGYQKR